MKTFFRMCTLLIIALVATYTIGCGDNAEQETDPIVLDTETTHEDFSQSDKQPIGTDGKPVTVTDATFENVVLNAEMPVVVELGAEW